jgi:hypothetical protein
MISGAHGQVNGDGDDSSEDATTCRGSFTIYVPHDMRPSNR